MRDEFTMRTTLDIDDGLTPIGELILRVQRSVCLYNGAAGTPP
jgi:hypothetical protein